MSSVTAQRLLLQGLIIGAIGLGLAMASPAAEKAAQKAAKIEKELTYIPTVKWLPKPVAVPNAEATEQAGMKAYREVLPGSDVTFQMLPIPGGTYTQGATEEEYRRFNKDNAEAKYDEGPQHEIAIEPFWMGKCEVTWDEFELWGLGLDKQRRAVTKTKATSHDVVADCIMQPTKPYTDMTFGMGKEGFPAICMTQLAATTYCKWLSAKTGRYYRLPTEAEWEYAARAGTKTAYSFGESADKLKDYAWYFDNSEDKYHKIGLKKPNPWGLYDIHGNVNEWVIDQYVPDFYKKCAGKVSKNPIAVPKTEFSRIVRGGSWDDNAARCRSAARRVSTKDWKMQDPQIPQSIWYLTDATFVGFRVVRPLRIPTEVEAMPFEPDVEALKEFKEAQADKQ